MKKIQKYVYDIQEELDSAREYAEKYIEFKASNEPTWASKFKTMANDELNHATTIHELATMDIQTIGKVYKAPQEMQEKWDKTHREFVEKTAWIKQMLAM